MASFGTKRGTSKGPRENYMNWGGWFPHPELDNDVPPRPRYERMADALHKEKLANVRIPAAYTFTLTDGLPLSVFRRHPLRCLPDMSIPPSLVERITKDTVHRACTVENRLVMVKPDEGTFAFIWRLARFHSGVDALVPVTAFWDLADAVGKITNGIVTFLDAKAIELADASGGYSKTAIMRWGRVLGRV